MQGDCGTAVTAGPTGDARGTVGAGVEMQGTASVEGPSPGPPTCTEHPGDREEAGRGGTAQGKQKALAFGCPSLGGPQHGASGGPTMLPTPAQPHSHPGPAGTSTRGMLGWHSLVKPAGAEPQSRVWGSTRSRGSCLSMSKPGLSGIPAPGHPRAGAPSSAQPMGMDQDECWALHCCPSPPALLQPLPGQNPGALSPCPALGRLHGAGRTLTPPALARRSSWHEGAGQGTWLRGDGATPDAFPPARRNRKHFLIGEPNKPQNN